jgi:hypothetical protein
MVRILALVVFVAFGCSHKEADKTPPAATPAKSTDVAAGPVGPVVDPVKFDRTCAAATDCVVVRRAGCDACACASDAIASKEMAHFDEVVGKLACEPPDLDRKCAPCQPHVATCENKLCVAKPRP